MKQVHTIGYQQAAHAQLIALLQEHGIEVLADVRALEGVARIDLVPSL